jgi:hypothetical protein
MLSQLCLLAELRIETLAMSDGDSSVLEMVEPSVPVKISHLYKVRVADVLHIWLQDLNSFPQIVRVPERDVPASYRTPRTVQVRDSCAVVEVYSKMLASAMSTACLEVIVFNVSSRLYREKWVTLHF